MLYIKITLGLEILWPEIYGWRLLAHGVTFGDFMAGNFMAGNFLTRIRV